MPDKTVTSVGEYFNLPNPGLRTYFGRVRAGNDEEYRTTFAKGQSLSKVLADWQPHIDKLSNKWPSLVEWENGMRDKAGPMSIMKPLSERMEDIDHYYDDVKTESSPVNPKAVKAVIREFSGVRGIRLRNQSSTLEKMKKSTNSGNPYFTKRKSVVNKTSPCSVYPKGKEVVQVLPSANWKSCAVLGWRGQEGGPTVDDVKQRVVWMFPFAVNLQELQFYQPFIEAAQKRTLVPAWVSMECVDERITKLFDTKGPEDLVICTDFSKFDQHFNASLQETARSIFQEILTQSKDSEEWLKNVFPIKYMIPLMYDYGILRFGNHGMGSGSGGTNADETVAHRALQYESALQVNQELNPNSQCLGDDGVLSFPGITVEDVMRSYTAHGLSMNESKQYASTQDCVYLRRWHHKDYRRDGVCVGVYSTFRALNRLCEQERYYDPEMWSKEMVALRQLSILENCKNHMLFEDFIKFCMERDKYRLGVDIPGFLDRIDKIADKAMELMPDFLGYTKSQQLREGEKVTGISNWSVVKYLRNLK